MNIWNNRKPAPPDDYRKDLASWQIAHDTNHHDMTRAQDARFRVHNLLLDCGLSPLHASFARWLVEHGQMARGDTDDDR